MIPTMWKVTHNPLQLRSFYSKLIILSMTGVIIIQIFKHRLSMPSVRYARTVDGIQAKTEITKRVSYEIKSMDDILRLWDSVSPEVKGDFIKLHVTCPGTESSPEGTHPQQKSKKMEQFREKAPIAHPPNRTVLLEILKQPIITPFQISYNINDPKTHCSGNDTDILIVVPSAPRNFERRTHVRESNQAIFVKDPKNRAKLRFFIGGTKFKDVQDRIDQEQSFHGDIVQATFTDTYKNITMKAATFLHWGSKFCSGAKFLIRTDDDVMVNTSALVAVLTCKSRTMDHFIVGFRRKNDLPAKDKDSKYSIPETQWAHDKLFPDYVLGGAYGFPMKEAGRLLETMRRTPLVWLDDLFVTGICAERLGISVLNDNAFKFGH